MSPEDPPGRRDLRLLPIATAAWGGAWLGTSGSAAGVAAGGVAAVVLVAAAVVRRSRQWVAAALVLLAALAIGWLQAQRLTSGPVASLAAGEAVSALEGEVLTDAQLHGEGRRSYVTVRLRVLAVTGRGASWRVRFPVLVVASGRTTAAAWPVGARIRFDARLQTPQAGSDVAAVALLRGPPTLVASPGPALRATERVRAGLRRAVSGRPAEPRALVPALVLGDTSGMTTKLQQEFRATGLTHLTAVSGANLTLLLAFLLLAARWLGVGGWWLRGVGLAGVVVFVALCRTEPSVLRAAAMGLVTLAALGTGGRRRGLRHLCVAAGVLVGVDPYLARSLGFTLSVLASAGIVWWATRWADLLQRWLPRIAAEAVAVPLAAHLATLPIVAGISGAVSVSGVVTNALAGPLVGPATVLGFAAAGLSLVSTPLAAAAGWGASWCAAGILAVAHAGALLPGSSWRWPATAPGLVLLAGCALLTGVAMPYVLRRWWSALGVALLMVVGMLVGPVQPGWPPPGWVFVACDVGQGDGLVVRIGPGEAMLVDAGPDPAAIDRCLDRLGVRRLTVVVLSHFHADHVEGLGGALSGRSVGEVWVSPLASPPAEAAAVSRLVAAAGVSMRTPAVGEQGRSGELDWQILGPVGFRAAPGVAAADDPESPSENDSSLVLRVTVRGVRVLFAGDVEPEGQARLLASDADLTVDVLKVAHHGSAHQDPTFLAATHARVAVASAGLHNDYGHPAPRTLQLLGSLGMTVLRTDQQGSVALAVENGQLSAVSQRRARDGPR